MTPNSGNTTVRIFSAKACAAPLKKAAKVFETQTGTHIEISVCGRHCAKPVAEEAKLIEMPMLGLSSTALSS